MKEIDPAKLSDMSIEELVEAREESKQAEVELKATQQVLKEEILSRMKTDGMEVGHWNVTRFPMTRFKTTLEQARLLGATKKEEKVDTDKLKLLKKNGVEVPGAEITMELRIKERLEEHEL